MIANCILKIGHLSVVVTSYLYYAASRASISFLAG